MSDSNICPTCKNPKKSSSSGSLTQWVLTCYCDLKPANEPASNTPVVNLCRDCGKRIGEGRAGSFTQFIFRSDVCQCSVPKPLRDALDNAPIAPQAVAIEDLQETGPALELDVFPSERYRALRVLGSGTTGTIYVADDKLLSKRVAVKILQMPDALRLVAFQDEARATSKLVHPGIVNILDFGIIDSTVPYMVLDYVPGISLEEFLRREGPLNIESTQDIFTQICDALAYAHANGIYHRDLKPSNILLLPLGTNKFQVKLIDFGIAKVQEQNGNTTEKQVVGTPLYMSPDPGLGRSYDARSEVYSLGCVIFEALAGQPPFIGVNALKTLSMHANDAPPKLSQVCNKQYGRSVEKLVATALEKEPEKRYQTMNEFRQALLNIDATSAYAVDRLTRTISAKLQPKKPAKVLMILTGAIALVLAAILFTTNAFHRQPSVVLENKPKPPVKDPMRIRSELDEEDLAGPTSAEIVKEIKFSDVDKWAIEGDQIRGYAVNDEDFKSIKTWPKHPTINIGLQANATGTGFRYLTKVPIECASVQSNYFNDAGAAELAKVKSLKRVELYYCTSLSERGIEKMAKGLPHLRHLKMRFWSQLPDHIFHALWSAPKLEGIDIGHSAPVTPDMMAEITGIKTLKTFGVSGTDFNDQELEILKKIPLRTLDINETAVTSKGLLSLTSSKTLTTITVSKSKEITDKTIKEFQKRRPDIALVIKDPSLLNQVQGLIPDVSEIDF